MPQAAAPRLRADGARSSSALLSRPQAAEALARGGLTDPVLWGHLVVMSKRARPIDWKKVEEMTLALMHLTSFDEHGAVRTWKGHDWEVLNRLHERGWISNPVSKAKAVALTEEGARLSNELFEKHFLRAG